MRAAQPKEAKPETRGRKRIPIDVEEVRRLAALGLTVEQIAIHMNVSISTLRKRRKDFEEFEITFQKGRVKSFVRMAELLDEHVATGNFNALKFKMQAQFGYGTQRAVELTGPAGGPVEVKDVSIFHERIAEKLNIAGFIGIGIAGDASEKGAG